MSKQTTSDSDQKNLQQLRVGIDNIDEKIQALIADRARCAQQIAKIKQGLKENHFYRPEREAEVLRKILARNEGPLEDEEMARLFREIMSACLALEAPMTIAFLGPEGTFTQEAALKHFGHSVNTSPLVSIDEVFREVESRNAHFGVVPIENSTEGVVHHTLDTFMVSPLRICGEVELRIHHHLLSLGESIDDITQVVSHQQSLAQCREWLDANLPKLERKIVASNAEAALQASKNKHIAAIAGDMAARLYGLNTLAPNIEDEADNTTRFLVISPIQTDPSGNDKTSLLVSGKNQSGALYDLLGHLGRNGINMTRIESRPSRRGTWQYVFFMDIDGHIQDKNVSDAIKELEQEATFLKLLGSYPKSVL